MIINLKLESQYLFNGFFAYKTRRTDIDEYFYFDKTLTIVPIIIQKIENLNEHFSRVFFKFVVEDMVMYQNFEYPFFTIYDDTSFKMSENLAETLYLHNKNVALPASKIHEYIILYDEEFVKKIAEIDKVIEYANDIIVLQEELKGNIVKEWFNEKKEFLTYDTSLQKMLNNTINENQS